MASDAKHPTSVSARGRSDHFSTALLGGGHLSRAVEPGELPMPCQLSLLHGAEVLPQAKMDTASLNIPSYEAVLSSHVC